ncbi:MAG: hypothetical protein N4A72_14640 [Bacteroidales bacterium]|jgi:phage gpG-like protein|nr:hypothetical protein [Bacteroidales bacterium]
MIEVRIDNIDSVIKQLKEKQILISKAENNRQFRRSTGQLLVSRAKLNIENSTAGNIPYKPLANSTRKQKIRQGYTDKPLERTGLLKSSLNFETNSGLYITAMNYLKYHQSDEPRTKLPQRKAIAITTADGRQIEKYLIRAIKG